MDQLDLITKNTIEIIGIEEIKKKIINKTVLIAYLQIEPIQEPSIDLLLYIIKVKDLVDAGVYVKILISDIYPYLTTEQESDNKTFEKSIFYKTLITNILIHLQVSNIGYEFIIGSELELDKNYVMRLFKFMSKITVYQAQQACNKSICKPLISQLVYPMLQVLNETVLEIDIHIGSIEEKDIFELSRGFIQSLGHSLCSYLIVPVIPCIRKSLNKLIDNCKIRIIDDRESIFTKINNSYCLEKNTNDNLSSCIAICKHIIYPLGECVGEYKTYIQFENMWKNNKMTVQEFKIHVASILNSILRPIRDSILEYKDLYNMAFVVNQKITINKQDNSILI